MLRKSVNYYLIKIDLKKWTAMPPISQTRKSASLKASNYAGASVETAAGTGVVAAPSM